MARAILIGSGTVYAAAFIRGWLAGGNEIAEIWWGETGSVVRSQRTASRWAPDWSVRRLAERHGIPIFKNPRLKRWLDGAIERAVALKADTLVTCMSMQIVPNALIDHFGGRAVNFHPALLPNYRGPSPLMGVLIDGVEREYSGITMHELTQGIDEGAIVAQRAVDATDAGRRYEPWVVRLAEAIDGMARDELPAFLAGRRSSVRQTGGNYRRVGNETIIGPHLTGDMAATLLERAGGTGRVAAISSAAGGRLSVKRPLRRLGEATGAPPLVTAFSVELDVADARVRVARWTQLDNGFAKLAMLRAMRAADRRRQE